MLEEVPNADLDRKEFLESSTVSATLDSDILTFSVENSDPRLAMHLATEYAHAFTEYTQELETQGAQTQSARVVREADEAPKVGPRTVRNGLLALCLGLVLALVVVFLADALDTRVRPVDAIRETLGLHLLGRLQRPFPPSKTPRPSDARRADEPTSRRADEPRRGAVPRTPVEPRPCQRRVRGTNDHGHERHRREGKSTTVANLAVALARAGRRVVLIDADPIDPHLHRLFNLDQRPGLTDVELGDTWLVSALRPIALEEEASEADHLGRRADRTGSLEALPGGSVLQDPDELGFEEAVGRIIQRVRGRFDVVLVDAPPVLRSNAIALSAHVDAVVVVRLKGLRASALQDLGWMLDESRATKLGFVVTGADKTEGYGQHPRYGSSERRPEARPRPTLTVSPSLPTAMVRRPLRHARSQPAGPSGDSAPARRR